MSDEKNKRPPLTGAPVPWQVKKPDRALLSGNWGKKPKPETDETRDETRLVPQLRLL